MKTRLLTGITIASLLLAGCGGSDSNGNETLGQLPEFEEFARQAYARDENETPLDAEDGVDLDTSTDSSDADFDDLAED